MQLKQLINEVKFHDEPLKSEYDPEMTKNIQFFKQIDPSIKDLSAHKLEGSNGHLVLMHRKGMHEIHHYDENMMSGYVKKNHHLNTKFIHTIIPHIKNHLDKGEPVRISAPHGSEMADKYKNLIHHISKRYPLDVHEKDSYQGPIKVKDFELHPRKHNDK